jgi:hypothetical protein
MEHKIMIRFELVILLFFIVLQTLVCDKKPKQDSFQPTQTSAINREKSEYLTINDVSDIFNAAVFEIPEPALIPQWRIESRMRGAEFQLPQVLADNAVLREVAEQPAFSGAEKITLKSQGLHLGEVRIYLEVWAGITISEYIRRQHAGGGIYAQTLIKVNRIKKPRNGFFFIQNLFEDHVLELVLDDGGNTVRFLAARPVRGFEREPAKREMTDDELQKILFSLKLPAK